MSFSPDQISQLSAMLDGAKVRERKQGGRQVSYIEGWHAIAEANRIFGFDAWDRETVHSHLVNETECIIGPGTRYEKDGWRVAYVATVQVTVRAGEDRIHREGTGYGSGIDADKGSAHESAVKEAETDAMKRALMTFGNAFGLALYDKEQAEVDHGEKPALVAPKPTTSATKANGHDEPVSKLAEWTARVCAAIANAKTTDDIDELLERCKVGLIQADKDDPSVARDIRARFTARRLILAKLGPDTVLVP